MANKQTQPKAQARKTSKASALPTPATAVVQAPAPAAATVALRGGLAIANVRLTGKPYRVAAPHNQQWWQAVVAAVGSAPSVPIGSVLLTPQNPKGAPAHFVGYAIRRGYLAAA